MTTNADVAPDLAVKVRAFAERCHPLGVLLLLAVAVRLPLAFWPNINHPDEIFQYLEPAWRLLGHDGIVTWEWRDGIRSWFLPTLFAGPVVLGDRLAPGGAGAFIVPRAAVGLASLSIVVSAWFFGARVSRMHAIVAALVAAIWFEIVYFAPHTLSEPLTTALIAPAALLLTGDLSWKRLAVGGALLALAFVWRFQYAPAMAVFALGACWRQWRNAIPLVSGGLLVLALAAMVDVAYGVAPFEWLILNIEQNLLHDRASEFGVAPAMAYLYELLIIWSGATLLLLCALRRGWRHAPLLIVAAVVNIAFHSAIQHKEYRFIFLSVVLLIIAAALGSADWGQMLRARPAWRRWALPIIAGGWVLLSLGLADTTKLMQDNWMRGTGAARLAADLRADPELCGLALYVTSYHLLPGSERLARGEPLYAFHPEDPLATGRLPVLVKKNEQAFNRIIAPPSSASELPADFSQRSCASMGDDGIACIFARSGACDATSATPFEINDVLVRLNY
ncbi:4-amino-4-deoxy-L-arabinose transferase [Bradyrhizobium centrolobii]|uniref:4-amino-4-deoxy-L-arabinose transferase n=1 Tax=Bradyrhizobium centrolobii TaxID=1505087 RepID=A0A176YXV8_9BRAD|nr:4-amino-4-deoxy-L-arabinose transferase [Bradyrhizobium centrolobii]OAF11715.1 4-amino-4-deoxy-L-arabinose transferase [Bradyrhizobium centrolobii]